MKIAIKILRIIIALTGAVLLACSFVPGTPWGKMWSYTATILLVFVPDALRLVGLKFSRELELSYFLFLIPSMILGIDLDFYKFVPLYDKIVHGVSGVLTAVVAWELMNMVKLKAARWYKALIIVSFVALIAVLWECFEFFIDKVFGARMQQLVMWGVDDTMWDMIVALIGGMATMFILLRKKSEE